MPRKKNISALGIISETYKVMLLCLMQNDQSLNFTLALDLYVDIPLHQPSCYHLRN